MASLKRHKIILSSLESQGCRIKETTKGWLIFFPDGESTMGLHKTDSDHRAEANNRARVLRAGLTWPFDGENRRR